MRANMVVTYTHSVDVTREKDKGKDINELTSG